MPQKPVADICAEPAGAGPLGFWPRLPRQGAPPIVVQMDEDGCGPACAEMLLRDRGFEVSQRSIAESVPLPAMASDLARRMVELSGLSWLGGSLSVSGEVTWKLLHGLSAVSGSWAALLEPLGFRRFGHWVVVDGVTLDGVVLVRDPAGSSYGIPLDDFASLWRYTVVVFEEPSP